MRTNFDDFMDELEDEAKAEGPEAVAQFHAFGEYFASVALQISSLRQKKKLTQQALAKRTGIQQAEISRIEKGKANPTLKTLATIGKALGAPILFRANTTSAKRVAAKKKRRTSSK